MATPTTGNDSLDGTSGVDTIDGLAGNDTINGLAGADSLTGGDGNDSITGGDGADTLTGGLGDDRIIDASGSDVIRAGEGANSITLTRSDAASADVLHVNAGDGADQLTYTGNAANTVNLVVNAGKGVNTVTATDVHTAQIVSNRGDDTITLSVTDYAAMRTGAGNDVIDLSESAGARSIGIGTGAGNDRVTLHMDHNAQYTLHLKEGLSGVGHDTIIFSAISGEKPHGANVMIDDFGVGDGDTADQLRLTSFLHSVDTRRSDPNAFNDGHLRLVQIGDNAHLQIDYDGAKGHVSGWQELIVFRGVDAHDLTAYNFSGLAPVVVDTTSADLQV